MNKKVLQRTAAALAVPVLCMGSVAAWAAEEPEVQNVESEESVMRFAHIVYVCCDLRASGHILTCSGCTETDPDYKASVYVELQQYSDGSWTTIKDWYQREWENAYIEERYAVLSGRFRVKCSHYSLDGNDTPLEEAITYSPEVII